mgnify:CR=1 FL=1
MHTVYDHLTQRSTTFGKLFFQSYLWTVCPVTIVHIEYATILVSDEDLVYGDPFLLPCVLAEVDPCDLGLSESSDHLGT